MEPLFYRCHRFSPEIIQNAVWLYCRFTLGYRDVEDLLAERGLGISYETVRRWVVKFGRSYARSLQRFRPNPNDRWHLDEMFVTIRGKRKYLWRAVDAEGERTNGQRIHISLFDDESERCSASNRPAPPNEFSPSTPPSTITSTSNVI